MLTTFWNAATKLSAGALLAALLLFPAAGRAQEAAPTLHVILAGDTLDESGGTTIVKGIAAWKAQFNTIAKSTQIKQNLQTVEGEQCTSAAVTKACNDLTVGSNDTVFFWYNGHGFNNPDDQAKSKWPAFYLQQRGDGTNIELKTVYQLLADKKPRLLVVMADCCNTVATWAHVPKRVPAGRDDDQITAQYKALFTEAKGSYLSSGCRLDQCSYFWPGSVSYYSAEVQAKLYNAVHSETKASWDAILTEVCKTELKAPTGDVVPQLPQFEKNPDLAADGK